MSGQDYQETTQTRRRGSSSLGTDNVISMADYIVRSGRAAERFFLRRLRCENQQEATIVWLDDYRS
jgi:hypothetical protein